MTLLLLWLASQSEQYIFRRRAERLLADIQTLHLGTTNWREAQENLGRWSRQTKVDSECNHAECSLQIELLEPVYRFAYKNLTFVHLDDYLRWRLKLSFDEGPFVRLEAAVFRGYMALGGRPARITASVGMRDGVVWAKGFSITIETYWHEIPGLFDGRWGEFTLIANARSVPQLRESFSVHPGDPQLAIHPTYYIGRPGGCEICVEGYALFKPDADLNDIHRLMRFNLSCLTRLRPCIQQGDIMPEAWKQHINEPAWNK